MPLSQVIGSIAMIFIGRPRPRPAAGAAPDDVLVDVGAPARPVGDDQLRRSRSRAGGSAGRIFQGTSSRSISRISTFGRAAHSWALINVPSGLIQLCGETITSYSSAISAMRRVSDSPLASVSIITTSVTWLLEERPELLAPDQALAVAQPGRRLLARRQERIRVEALHLQPVEVERLQRPRELDDAAHPVVELDVDGDPDVRPDDIAERADPLTASSSVRRSIAPSR